MFSITDPHPLLTALGEQLAARAEAFEIVVIGGSGLLALGVIDRPTQDVDVVALMEAGGLQSADPLPPALVDARDRVSRDFNLGADWLNTGPSQLLTHGLPEGFESRVESRRYGSSLVVHFASRLDQVHFKVYAVVDRGGGKHLDDLRALQPTPDELIQAARWTRTHDPSPAHLETLERVLAHFGITDADLGT
jgi:hypothetical protein